MATAIKTTSQNFSSPMMSGNWRYRISLPRKNSTIITSMPLLNKEKAKKPKTNQFQDRTRVYAVTCSEAMIITKVTKQVPYKSSILPS